VHWARLEASALGSLNAACPAWKKERKKERGQLYYVLYLSVFTGCFDVVFTGGHQLRNWITTVIGLLMWILHWKSGVYSAEN